MAKWKSGESGNRGGRPKEVGDLRILARERTQEALNTLVSVMNDKSSPSSARVAAANSILDRGYGKPTLPIENLTPEPPLDLADAARRIAFAINSAILQGKIIDGEFSELLGELPKAGD